MRVLCLLGTVRTHVQWHSEILMNEERVTNQMNYDYYYVRSVRQCSVCASCACVCVSVLHVFVLYVSHVSLISLQREEAHALHIRLSYLPV